MRRANKQPAGPGRRTVGPVSDALNVVLFVGALALVFALLAMLDPSVKQLFLRLLP